jgi:hypothetical protein
MCKDRSAGTYENQQRVPDGGHFPACLDHVPVTCVEQFADKTGYQLIYFTGWLGIEPRSMSHVLMALHRFTCLRPLPYSLLTISIVYKSVYRSIHLCWLLTTSGTARGIRMRASVKSAAHSHGRGKGPPPHTHTHTYTCRGPPTHAHTRETIQLSRSRSKVSLSDLTSSLTEAHEIPLPCHSCFTKAHEILPCHACLTEAHNVPLPRARATSIQRG